MVDFELVVPAYNESKTLPTLVQRAADAALGFGYSPETFQFVIVENGSSDESKAVLGELAKGTLSRWFRVVYVPINRGYGYGVHAGLQSVTARYVGWSHADMQCDPKDAFRCLEILKSSHNQSLIKGRRIGRNWQDRFVSFIFSLSAGIILGLWWGEINAQPKVFHRDLLNSVKNPPSNFAFDLYVLYQARRSGYDCKTVEVTFPPRIHGMSRWAATFVGRYRTILGMIGYMVKLAVSEGRI